MISRPLTQLPEPLDTDLQAIAAELDVSAKNLRVIAGDNLEDGITLGAFGALVRSIEGGECEVMTFDDNTVLYDWQGDNVIVHTAFSVKYLIFEATLGRKIENALFRFVELR